MTKLVGCLRKAVEKEDYAFLIWRVRRRAVDVGKANWRIGLEGGYQLLPVGDVGG